MEFVKHSSSRSLLINLLILPLSILCILNCSSTNTILQPDNTSFQLSSPIVSSENDEHSSIVKYQVVVKNTGIIPIRINSVRTNYGGLIPEWSLNEIGENEESIIILKYYPKKNATNLEGEVVYKIWISINNKEEFLLLNIE